MLEAYIVSLTLRYISLASTERTLWFGAKKNGGCVRTETNITIWQYFYSCHRLHDD